MGSENGRVAVIKNCPMEIRDLLVRPGKRLTRQALVENGWRGPSAGKRSVWVA